MSIESSPHKLRSSDIVEPTQILAAGAWVKYIQRWRLHGNQAVSQTIFSSTPDLSVVVPTRNEHDNIEPLLETLQIVLWGLHVEVIFVDDSDDDTPEVIKMCCSGWLSTPLFHIKLEHRLAGDARAGGLATAVVHGMNRAQAEYVAVIDADLQHPPELLRVFYDQAVAQNADLVLASRYIKGGGYQGLDGVGRRFISVGLKWTAKLLFPEQLLRISDPLSGFFLLRRSLLADVSLRPIGYKILLEILLRCPWRKVLEVPYHFQPRAHGQSKANMRQGILALRHMQRLWREVPAAGRVWTTCILVLLNVLIALALSYVTGSFPWLGANLNIAVFAVMACLDFVLFNRFILPSPVVANSVEAERLPTPALTSTEDMERVELASPQNAISNGHHLYSIEDMERVELASPQNAITNGYHLYSIEDMERVELPSAKQVLASAFNLIQKSQPTRKKKFYDKFPSVAAVAVVILAIG